MWSIIISGYVWRLVIIVLIVYALIKQDKIRHEIINEYMPVRMIDLYDSPPGRIFEDDESGNIKSSSSFSIKNHSNVDRKVTFLLYQDTWSTSEKPLFHIDHVYIYERFYDDDTAIEAKNGVVTIPSGKCIRINLKGIARDNSKVKTSRGGPIVEIVVLD